MTAHIMKILLVEDDKLLNHHLSSLLTEADCTALRRRLSH